MACVPNFGTLVLICFYSKFPQEERELKLLSAFTPGIFMCIISFTIAASREEMLYIPALLMRKSRFRGIKSLEMWLGFNLIWSISKVWTLSFASLSIYFSLGNLFLPCKAPITLLVSVSQPAPSRVKWKHYILFSLLCPQQGMF